MIQVRGITSILVLFLALAGCSSKSPNYYGLYSIQSSGPDFRAADPQHEIAVGVGPVKIPEYLDRPQIATRTTPGSFQFAEFDKWAEALDKNLTRVLADNLSILLPSDHVFTYPWPKGGQVQYQVTVDILRLEKMSDQKIILDARWNVFGNSEEKLFVMKRSRMTMPVESAGYDGVASAESRAVEALSREIADAIRSLPPEAYK
jgi:uncharacterized lipoprotein YmbA